MTARRLDHLLRERDRLHVWQSVLLGTLAGLIAGWAIFLLRGTP